MSTVLKGRAPGGFPPKVMLKVLSETMDLDGYISLEVIARIRLLQFRRGILEVVRPVETWGHHGQGSHT